MKAWCLCVNNLSTVTNFSTLCGCPYVLGIYLENITVCTCLQIYKFILYVGEAYQYIQGAKYSACLRS